MADTYDLGSYVERHAGSSPVARTSLGSHSGFTMTTFSFYVRYEHSYHIDTTIDSIALTDEFIFYKPLIDKSMDATLRITLG